jgi:hypothetical protein
MQELVRGMAVIHARQRVVLSDPAAAAAFAVLFDFLHADTLSSPLHVGQGRNPGRTHLLRGKSGRTTAGLSAVASIRTAPFAPRGRVRTPKPTTIGVGAFRNGPEDSGPSTAASRGWRKAQTIRLRTATRTPGGPSRISRERG